MFEVCFGGKVGWLGYSGRVLLFHVESCEGLVGFGSLGDNSREVARGIQGENSRKMAMQRSW